MKKVVVSLAVLAASITGAIAQTASDDAKANLEATRFLRQQMHRLKRHPANASAVQQAELDEFANHYAQYFARDVEATTNTSITLLLSRATLTQRVLG